jgi:hypothetical protein
MAITWDARDDLAEAAVAGLLADTQPEMCQWCGSIKVDDMTPGYVYKENDICECPDLVGHLHEWNLIKHFHHWMAQFAKPCEICSICDSYKCEIT